MQIGNRCYYFGRDMRPIRNLIKSFNVLPNLFHFERSSLFLDVIIDIWRHQYANIKLGRILPTSEVIFSVNIIRVYIFHIFCGMLFATGAITFYEGNNMLSALAKYVIHRLIHDLFHSALVISPRLISSLGLKPSGSISRSRADNKGNMKKAMY